MENLGSYSRSQGFVNLLTSQEEHTLCFSPSLDLGSSEVPSFRTQVSDQPNTAADERKERRKWSPVEDVVLISTWLNTFKDPVISNEHKAGSFWKRIKAYFNHSPQLVNEQDGESVQLKQRWQQINDHVCKFVGCYETAMKEQTSGQNENDVMKADTTINGGNLNMLGGNLDTTINGAKEGGKPKKRKLDDTSAHSSSSQTQSTLNDINVLERSPVYDDILQGRAPKLQYWVNGHKYNLAYYLTDETWPIVGKDLVVAVQSFFKLGFLPKGANSTILALIPKKKEAKTMKDYRPISCCNVIYKIISKILANRLKVVLPKFIAPNQSAFVKDRLLMENLLLATELVKDYHKETITPRCAMKIDISKAFDSVQWRFLLNTLKALNIPEKYVHWIDLCISTASFSVQVNCELAGYFGSKRGLRQGCSLSPYLFVICMNVLSKKLDKAALEGKFGYHPTCQELQLTHLCFADDLMVFVDGNKRSVEGVLEVFDDFAIHSGLHISLEKSTIYMAGIENVEKEAIIEQFPFESGNLPVRYLGLPLLTRRMTSADYLPLIEKIRSQITSWSARPLSFGGRLQLLNSVVFSLTNFWISAFRLPKSCIQEIDKLCSAFLWSGPALNSRKTKVAWSVVTTPKREGGLGLKSLEVANKVSVLKIIWRLLSKKSLWVDWVKQHLIRGGSFWSVTENSVRGSWIWKKLLKYRVVAKTLYKWDLKNGFSISFWFDEWSSMGCLFDIFGSRGCIDLGVSLNATLGSILDRTRIRRHRYPLLRQIEDELVEAKRNRMVDEEDVALWKNKTGLYTSRFLTKDTLGNLRSPNPDWEAHKAIWFQFSTPKYAFVTWLAARNRLETGERMERWNINVNLGCSFCTEPRETREHLFFSCPFTSLIWEKLVKGIQGTNYTSNWQSILAILMTMGTKDSRSFIVKYAFQMAIHSIWRERNRRRHGEDHCTNEQLLKTMDVIMRNRLSTIRLQGKHQFEDGVRVWFATKAS
ncbi:uncharacterized protein LOC112088307 [Eutrema salsugineum]|uniref:uncharacterized protein LOC112088307 n=1 Tax=Eutrema salsugineum TaxID=72664 RepID=UPI000CED3711|nr:uncharacterized protein LOC112088307 [Eutrema salsugineum]